MVRDDGKTREISFEDLLSAEPQAARELVFARRERKKERTYGETHGYFYLHATASLQTKA